MPFPEKLDRQHSEPHGWPGSALRLLTSVAAFPASRALIRTIRGALNKVTTPAPPYNEPHCVSMMLRLNRLPHTFRQSSSVARALWPIFPQDNPLAALLRPRNDPMRDRVALQQIHTPLVHALPGQIAVLGVAFQLPVPLGNGRCTVLRRAPVR